MVRVKTKRYQFWFFEACMFLLVVVGGLSCFSGFQLDEQQKHLLRAGHMAAGTERGSYSIRTSRFNVEYGVKYQFTLGRHTYYGDSPVSHTYYRTIRAGYPTEVLYLKDNPAINLDRASRGSDDGVNLMLSGFLTAAVGASIGIFILVSDRRVTKKASPPRKY